MIFSHISTEWPVTSITLARDYMTALALYSAVCNKQSSKNSLLLESADIEQKIMLRALF